MPKVGKKEFAYTPKGMAMAKAEAKKTGNKMVVAPPVAKTRISSMGTQARTAQAKATTKATPKVISPRKRINVSKMTPAQKAAYYAQQGYDNY